MGRDGEGNNVIGAMYTFRLPALNDRFDCLFTFTSTS